MAKDEEFKILKIKIVELKVMMHCEGCRNKVKKILQKVEGVFSVSVDDEKQKITVSGNVNPQILIKRLMKSGKHAELWSTPKKNTNQAKKENHKNTNMETFDEKSLLANMMNQLGSGCSGKEAKKPSNMKNSDGLDQLGLMFGDNKFEGFNLGAMNFPSQRLMHQSVPPVPICSNFQYFNQFPSTPNHGYYNYHGGGGYHCDENTNYGCSIM